MEKPSEKSKKWEWFLFLWVQSELSVSPFDKELSRSVFMKLRLETCLFEMVFGG